MRNKIYLILFLVVVGIILICKPFTDDLHVDKNLERFQSEKFTIVKNVIKRRGYFLVCQNLKNNEEFEISPSDELLANIEVGDTLHKLPDSNLCIISNGNKQLKLQCYPDDLVPDNKYIGNELYRSLNQ